MIPVEEWLTTSRHPVDRWHIDRWQTLVAGLLALVAAWWTVRATRSTAKDQIDATREEADRVIVATREQTSLGRVSRHWLSLATRLDNELFES